MSKSMNCRDTPHVLSVSPPGRLRAWASPEVSQQHFLELCSKAELIKKTNTETKTTCRKTGAMSMIFNKNVTLFLMCL